jgi:signal transduction histidine kinase/ActR/RegA family two-component response regulator
VSAPADRWPPTPRARQLFAEQRAQIFQRTDRLFARLMVAQWVVGIALAFWLTPATWNGGTRSVHVHVLAAPLLGGILTSLPVWLVIRRPGDAVTRYVIAGAQMLWSALLIHLTGGRIETHFHVFGSLAFLAFYRDWKVLVPAAIVVAGDHFMRGLFWPESVYGLANPEWWRFLEHGFWVVFECFFLTLACLRGVREIQGIADRQARLEGTEEEVRALNGQLEERVEERTHALAETNAALEARIAELKTAKDRLLVTDRLASLGQLAAGIGHEINNPLSYVILNMKEVARSGSVTQEAHHLIGEALDGAERIRRIVGDLRSMVRSGGREETRVDVHHVLESAIRLATNHIRHRGRLVRQYGSVPDIDGDPNRLVQVFLNLVVNAAQALEGLRQDGHEIRVVTRTSPGGGAVIELIDTGVGIPADRLPLLFDPFFTTKAAGLGTGLGLTICHGIVTEHGGTIEVESQPGAGSRFIVSFPPPRVIDDVDEEEVTAVLHAPPAADLKRRRGRLLVIDDEPLVLRGIQRNLAVDYEVVTAESGGQALALLAGGQSIDAIVCDLMMPGLTGMDLHRRLAADYPGLERRMIFVTGGAFTAESIEFLREHRMRAADKPIDFAVLDAMIRTAIESKRRAC